MKTYQHTPGPWNFGQVGKGQVFDIIGPDVTGRGREYVGSFRADQNKAANVANAQLIAAAPALLIACEQAKREACEGETYKILCAAISKARGET